MMIYRCFIIYYLFIFSLMLMMIMIFAPPFSFFFDAARFDARVLIVFAIFAMIAVTLFMI